MLLVETIEGIVLLDTTSDRSELVLSVLAVTSVTADALLDDQDDDVASLIWRLGAAEGVLSSILILVGSV